MNSGVVQPEHYELCNKKSTIAALATETRLGFSASDALDALSHPASPMFTWSVPQGESGLSFSPDESSALQIILSSHQGPIVLAEGESSECVPALRIPVSVQLSTAGGALNEVAVGTLDAESLTRARLSFRIPVADLTGSLKPGSPGKLATYELVGDVVFSGAASSGELRLEGTRSADGSSVSINEPVATW